MRGRKPETDDEKLLQRIADYGANPGIVQSLQRFNYRIMNRRKQVSRAGLLRLKKHGWVSVRGHGKATEFEITPAGKSMLEELGNRWED